MIAAERTDRSSMRTGAPSVDGAPVLPTGCRGLLELEEGDLARAAVARCDADGVATPSGLRRLPVLDELTGGRVVPQGGGARRNQLDRVLTGSRGRAGGLGHRE